MRDFDPVSGPDLNAGDLKTVWLIKFCDLRWFVRVKVYLFGRFHSFLSFIKGTSLS